MNRQARNPLEALVPRLRRYAGSLSGTVGDAKQVIQSALGRTVRPDRRRPGGISPAEGDTAEEAFPLRDRVRRSFLTLSEDQRDILHLVCVEELPYREVAEIYSVDVVTVMSRLVDARLALHDKLAADGGNQSESA